MKTLIIYASKHGTCEKIVKTISKKIKCDVKNLNIVDSIDLSQYNKIIIGGPIYAGSIHKKIKQFVNENSKELVKKKLGLFICGLNDREFKEEFENAYSKELRESATLIETLTGEIIFTKLNFFEKIIVKMVMKTKDDILKLNTKRVEKFALKFEKV